MWVKGLTSFIWMWPFNCFKIIYWKYNGTFVKNELTVNVWVYIWNPNPIPLVYVMPIPHFLGYDFSVESFEIRKCEFSNFVLFQDHSGWFESHALSYECNVFLVFPTVTVPLVQFDQENPLSEFQCYSFLNSHVLRSFHKYSTPSEHGWWERHSNLCHDGMTEPASSPKPR